MNNQSGGISTRLLAVMVIAVAAISVVGAIAIFSPKDGGIYIAVILGFATSLGLAAVNIAAVSSLDTKTEQIGQSAQAAEHAATQAAKQTVTVVQQEHEATNDKVDKLAGAMNGPLEAAVKKAKMEAHIEAWNAAKKYYGIEDSTGATGAVVPEKPKRRGGGSDSNGGGGTPPVPPTGSGTGGVGGGGGGKAHGLASASSAGGQSEGDDYYLALEHYPRGDSDTRYS